MFNDLICEPPFVALTPMRIAVHPRGIFAPLGRHFKDYLVMEELMPRSPSRSSRSAPARNGLACNGPLWYCGTLP